MKQQYYFDFKKFGKTFTSNLKYGDSLRKIGASIGVSAATLSRLRKGKTVDVNTAINVCAWMEMNFNTFIKDSETHLMYVADLNT